MLVTGDRVKVVKIVGETDVAPGEFDSQMFLNLVGTVIDPCFGKDDPKRQCPEMIDVLLDADLSNMGIGKGEGCLFYAEELQKI